MKIKHAGEHEAHGDGSEAFLLHHDGKGYFSLGGDSHYQGWVVDANGMYKLLSNLTMPGEQDTLVYEQNRVRRDYGNASETYYLSKNALHYSSTEGTALLELDCRPIHDFDDEGRIYSIDERPGGICLITYTKYATKELETVTHQRYIAVKGATAEEGRWEHRHYGFDAERNARSDLYVYAAEVECDADTVTLAHGKSASEAIDRVNRAAQRSYTESAVSDVVGDTAFHSLQGLHTETGLQAGLPWFFQHWFRDHLISLSGYRARGKYWHVKDVIMELLGHVHEDGWMLNHASASDLRSADATGWLFMELHAFLQSVDVYDYFSQQELEDIMGVLEVVVDGVTSHHYHNGLVCNNGLETWMDTAKDGHDRKGCRVEIQALYARLYQCGRYLQRFVTSDIDYGRLEENLAFNTRHYLYNGMLCDGYDGDVDETIRPNVFLAYYVYPDLLSATAWKDVFDTALDALWLDWGGLSSIDTSHELFEPEYQGQSNESYHFGDSWYFLNNIAALTMHRLDTERYEEYATAIYKASVDEMLYSGYVGHCAEVSSAMQRESRGCRCQAWSAATLLCLHEELF